MNDDDDDVHVVKVIGNIVREIFLLLQVLGNR